MCVEEGEKRGEREEKKEKKEAEEEEEEGEGLAMTSDDLTFIFWQRTRIKRWLI